MNYSFHNLYVHYRTTDPLNGEDAIQRGANVGLRVHVSFPKEALPPLSDPSWAVVFDLDYLPDGKAELFALPPGTIAAVHGFGLSPEERRELANRGVFTSRHLDNTLFGRVAVLLEQANRVT